MKGRNIGSVSGRRKERSYLNVLADAGSGADFQVAPY
jgi:hypothetical protein